MLGPTDEYLCRCDAERAIKELERSKGEDELWRFENLQAKLVAGQILSDLEREDLERLTYQRARGLI